MSSGAIGLRTRIHENTEAIIANSMSGSNNISRSFLTVVRMTLSNKEIDTSSIAVLDSGSDVNIIIPRCCQLLRLKGEAIVLNIIGADGIASRVQTKRIELIVKDKSVVWTLI